MSRSQSSAPRPSLLSRLSWTRPGRAKGTCRPSLECLEDRCTPATFTVLNNNDAGPNSLRQALLDAASNSEADIIRFAPGLSNQTITLTSAAANTSFGPTALVINNDVITIDGSDAPHLAI